MKWMKKAWWFRRKGTREAWASSSIWAKGRRSLRSSLAGPCFWSVKPFNFLRDVFIFPLSLSLSLSLYDPNRILRKIINKKSREKRNWIQANQNQCLRKLSVLIWVLKKKMMMRKNILNMQNGKAKEQIRTLLILPSTLHSFLLSFFLVWSPQEPK